MSSTGSPYGELPPTEDAATALDVTDPHEHHWFTEPTKPVSSKYVGILIVAQLVFFVALLGPAIIGMAIKVQAITDSVARRPRRPVWSSLSARSSP